MGHSLKHYTFILLSQNAKWTNEEEIVLLYYASRQIKYATIVESLAKNCNPGVGTVKEITQKAARLRTGCGQKEIVLVKEWPAHDREWDRMLADRWLLSRMEKDKIEELLEFYGETAAIIDEVSGFGDFW